MRTARLLLSLSLAMALGGCRIPAALLQRLDPECIFYVATDAPMVALSIDDAPDARSDEPTRKAVTTTLEIADVIEQHRGRATFFVITDQMPGAPGVVRELHERGHEIGNHLTIDDEFTEETTFVAAFEEAHALLADFGPRLFRPPSGHVPPGMEATLEPAGYRCIMADIYPLDVSHSWEGLSAWWLRRSRPGSIVVLHDREPRGSRTVRILERALPDLRDDGYCIVTVSELLSGEVPERCQAKG